MITSKRQEIESLRMKLSERNADSNYTNQFLYQTLSEQAKWLIRREINSGKLYKNVSFFQTLSCQNVIEVSNIDSCCPVKTNCKIYRTECKLPDTWTDEDGPIIKSVTSVDNSTKFQLITPTTWQSKSNDPYQKMSKQNYTFYSDGYLWFPEVNPHRVNILGFWTDDVLYLDGCSNTKDCIRYLDTKFAIPDWVEAEMMAKAVELLAGVTKRIQEDSQIDKNVNRKN